MRRWLIEHESFRANYAKAKRIQLDILAEDILDVQNRISTYEDERGNTRVDSGSVAAVKLEHDNRKWLLSKLVPKKYGNSDIEIEQRNDAITNLTKAVANLTDQYKSDV